MHPKPYWRRVITIRWLRWVMIRAAMALVPGLARALHLPSGSTDVRRVASNLLEDSVSHAPLLIGDRLKDKIIQPAARAEGMNLEAYMGRAFAIHNVCAIVSGCLINGRIMASIHERQNALLCAGAAVSPNWNASKPGRIMKRVADPHIHYAPATSGGHYCHFLADDILPLFHFLRKRADDLGQVRVLLRPDQPQFVYEILKAIRTEYSCLSWEEIAQGEAICGASVLFARRGSEKGARMAVDLDDLLAFRALLFEHYGLAQAHTPPSRKIYVSRAGARVRNLKNEGDLWSALQAHSFERFVPLASNHPAQICGFHEAQTVIAVHGAALANLIFCRPGATVIELFAANQLRPLYLWLAHQLGLRYRAVVGGQNDLWQNFSVEVSDVLREAKRACAPQELDVQQNAR
jgi:hypothetical protein